MRAPGDGMTGTRPSRPNCLIGKVPDRFPRGVPGIYGNRAGEARENNRQSGLAGLVLQESRDGGVLLQHGQVLRRGQLRLVALGIDHAQKAKRLA